ncbi:MAG: DUF1549 domain-containing protein [Bryobacteraceae bacterium]
MNAFNRDLPYNRFIIEQIAGDLLPNRTQDELVATGFLRNSMINEEGGADPEQFRMEAMFDRIDAISKSVLGVTIQCAQCHNHKFDPIKQEEYYQVFAFLNDSMKPMLQSTPQRSRWSVRSFSAVSKKLSLTCSIVRLTGKTDASLGSQRYCKST